MRHFSLCLSSVQLSQACDGLVENAKRLLLRIKNPYFAHCKIRLLLQSHHVLQFSFFRIILPIFICTHQLQIFKASDTVVKSLTILVSILVIGCTILPNGWDIYAVELRTYFRLLSSQHEMLFEFSLFDRPSYVYSTYWIVKIQCSSRKNGAEVLVSFTRVKLSSASSWKFY